MSRGGAAFLLQLLNLLLHLTAEFQWMGYSLEGLGSSAGPNHHNGSVPSILPNGGSLTSMLSTDTKRLRTSSGVRHRNGSRPWPSSGVHHGRRDGDVVRQRLKRDEVRAAITPLNSFGKPVGSSQHDDASNWDCACLSDGGDEVPQQFSSPILGPALELSLACRKMHHVKRFGQALVVASGAPVSIKRSPGIF
jgi:hypothetical protein